MRQAAIKTISFSFLPFLLILSNFSGFALLRLNRRYRSLGVNFSRRDPHRKNAKFGFVKFRIASSAFLRKKQPFEVVFYFIVKGAGAWMAKSLPTPFNPPPPTTLLMWRHGFALRAKRRRFKFAFSGYGSRRVKFDFKFERKKIRRSIAR